MSAGLSPSQRHALGRLARHHAGRGAVEDMGTAAALVRMGLATWSRLDTVRDVVLTAKGWDEA